MKCDFHLSIWSMITSGENGNKTVFKFLGKNGSNSVLEKHTWYYVGQQKLQYKLLELE